MSVSGPPPTAHATSDRVVKLTIEKSRPASDVNFRVVPPAASVHVPALSSWVMEASPDEATMVAAASSGARLKDTAARTASSNRVGRRRIKSWLLALHGLDRSVSQRFNHALSRRIGDRAVK